MFQRERLYDSAPVHPWLLGTLETLWASPFPSRLANRVWPNRVRHYPTDRLFTSRCSPPRLAATQLRSVTCGYMPARLGLSPCCLCALVGALGGRLAAPPLPHHPACGSRTGRFRCSALRQLTFRVVSHSRSLCFPVARPPCGRLKTTAFMTPYSPASVRAFDGDVAARPIRFRAFRLCGASLASPAIHLLRPLLTPADRSTPVSRRPVLLAQPGRPPGVRHVTFRTQTPDL